jgi:hypothetical protein
MYARTDTENEKMLVRVSTGSIVWFSVMFSSTPSNHNQQYQLRTVAQPQEPGGEHVYNLV